MSGRIDVNPNQLVIPCHADLVPEGVYPTVDPEKRISLSSLLQVVTSTVKPGKEPTVHDYFNAEPQHIGNGLYIHPSSGKYHTAQHTIRVGVPKASSVRNLNDFGVVFPATEYAVVARNPRDFGRHIVNKTQLARLSDPDREESEQAAKRSAGHALIAKIHSQKQLVAGLEAERDIYAGLYKDLRDPFRTRYKAKNLEKQRALADEKVHETVEVAAIHLELGNVARMGVHKAIRKNLYNGNYSRAQFSYNWMRYLTMIGLHNRAKHHKLELSRAMASGELKIYQPYLDAKAERDRQAA